MQQFLAVRHALFAEGQQRPRGMAPLPERARANGDVGCTGGSGDNGRRACDVVVRESHHASPGEGEGRRRCWHHGRPRRQRRRRRPRESRRLSRRGQGPTVSSAARSAATTAGVLGEGVRLGHTSFGGALRLPLPPIMVSIPLRHFGVCSGGTSCVRFPKRRCVGDAPFLFLRRIAHCLPKCN